MSYFDKTLTYYVVFRPIIWERKAWWNLFTKKEFSHVFLVKPLNDNQCLLIDTMRNFTIIDTIDEPVSSYLVKCQQAGATAILQTFTHYGRVPLRRYEYGSGYCVSFVKSVLALYDARRVITPFQLYKKLLKLEDTLAIKPYVPYIKQENR